MNPPIFLIPGIELSRDSFDNASTVRRSFTKYHTKTRNKQEAEKHKIPVF